MVFQYNNRQCSLLRLDNYLKKIYNSKNMEDFWVNSIGKILYSKVIEKYNQKMWLVDNNKKIDTFTWSPKGATLKKGKSAAWEGVLSCYPIKYNGYNDFFDLLFKKKIMLRNVFF